MAQFLSYIISLVFPALLVFKNLILGTLATWGDAPYFYHEALSALVKEPSAWVQRGLAFGGPNNFLWLSPLMIIYGLIGSSDLAVKVIFYFPSVILSGFGAYFLAKYLNLSKIVRFFTALVYLLNTYYLLLIDGGQVGVALAYGVFPWSLICLKKFIEIPSVKTFYRSLILLLLLTIADPRVAIICILTCGLWVIFEGNIKKLVSFIPLLVASVGLNMYWFYPLIKNGVSFFPAITDALGIKWYHPFFLLSPHWPDNIFGKISTLNPLFIGVPILIFLGVFWKGNKKLWQLVFVFLAFSILSLGIFPFDKIPFGFIFRDSTKFFIPAVLVAGILIGYTIESIKNRFLVVIVFLYLLSLISPALFGKLNFVLSGKQDKSNYQKIDMGLREEDGFLRTVWFPEKHPLTSETENKPAVDARDLVKFWPFASMNTGEDSFNFINNTDFVSWFRILGVKYLILSDNPREITKNEKDLKDWQTIQDLIAANPDLERVDWGTSFPIYKVSDSYPKFFEVKKLTAVIGSLPSDVYNLPNTVFFEDGKFDPTLLEGKPAESVELIFNQTEKTDLAMSFLAKYFKAPTEAIKNQWARYSSTQYLKYKYELLVRGVDFTSLDYGKGVAFSTVKGEKIEYNFKVPEKGEYILVFRVMTPEKGETHLKWESLPLTLAKGNYHRVIENNSQLQILNVVGLIPKKEYDAALAKADVFTKHFKKVEFKDLKKEIDYKEVTVNSWGNLKYNFVPQPGYSWLIMTDNYHPLWKLRKGSQFMNPVPAFSMVNAFYVDEGWEDVGIEFKGQDSFRRGLYWSGVTAITLVITCLWLAGKSNNE